MKRLVERRRLLPAFALPAEEVHVLWLRIISLFDSDVPMRRSIVVWPSESERLEFDTIEELLACRELRGEVTKFELVVEQRGKAVRLQSHISWLDVPFLEATADTDTWCAAAFEAVLLVVRRNSLWYGWTLRALILPAYLVALLATFTTDRILEGASSTKFILSSALVATLLALTYLLLRKDRLLPLASIVFTEERGFLRRFAGELGLLLAVAGIVLSIYMWLNPVAA
jgi:hypothetical protein